MKNLVWLKGFIYGIFLSGIIPFIFMLVAQRAAGGVTSPFGESWLYYAVLLPFVSSSSILGHLLHRNRDMSNKKKWLISLLSAKFITLFSGTIGVILGEFVVRGEFTSIVVDDTLFRGTVYSFLLLPISVPIMRLNIEVLSRIVNK